MPKEKPGDALEDITTVLERMEILNDEARELNRKMDELNKLQLEKIERGASELAKLLHRGNADE